MNCKQAQNIPLKTILKSFSFLPSKTSRTGAFYFAIDRKEKTPSLHLNYARNIAHDFGTGKSYDAVSLVQAIKGCSVSEALDYLSNLSSFSFPKQDSLKEQPAAKRKKESDIKIRKVKPVEHPALISYLKKRKVYQQRNQVKEIHYTIEKKFYFGIGFRNDSNGYELRNKYSKLCLGKKDVTTLKKGHQTLRLFEGFFDFLSFLQVQDILEMGETDYLILNSISLINRAEEIAQNYSKIELFLDNDSAGDKATETLIQKLKSCDDNRLLYRNFKDLNDYLIDR